MLLVACAFPPTGGPGVQRSAKFAKYLPQFGWSPTIWTVEHMDGFPRDPSLLADLPAEVTIHRRGCGGTVHAVRRSLKPVNGHRLASKVARAIGWRLDAWLERRAFPDGYGSWARASVRPLCRLVAKEGVSAVYTTLSPASNHLVGLALKRRTGLPWVADFRDLWTDDYRYRETSRRRRIAKRRLEQEILETADVVIGVTERQTEILANHVPLRRSKFVTITNGFDPTDFLFDETDVPSRGKEETFVLAYIGRFDRWRASDAWFDGLQRFVRGLGECRRRFMLRLVGHASPDTRERINSAGITCDFIGYVSHADAVREMGSADALLLCIPDGPNADSTIPAKLFEYLASRRPILAVGPRGGQCELIVKRCEAGLTAGFNDKEIAEALERLYEAWNAGHPLPGCRPDHLGQYSRVELTRRLASILDALVGAEADIQRTSSMPLAACLS